MSETIKLLTELRRIVDRLEKIITPAVQNDETAFRDHLQKHSYQRTFADGQNLLVVDGSDIPRKLWPLQSDGKPYKKLTDLAKVLKLQVMRQAPTQSQIYLVIA